MLRHDGEAARVQLPAGFDRRRRARAGAVAGRAADRVEKLTARWGLDLGDPFEPGGNCSWVAPGVDRDGRDIVLQVAWQHTEALHEAEGLAALAGHGAVEVYAFEHLPRDARGR